MKRQTVVYVTTSFVGYHRWKNAPECAAFLRDWHRHVFHVRVEVEVGGLDREVEFIELKNKVDDFIASRWKDESFEASCEMIAEELLEQFLAVRVEVSEDGENGSVVTRSIRSSAWRKCFVGIEAEGPNRGAVVLFVPGSVSVQRLKKVVPCVLGRFPIERVYYGAAGDYSFVHGAFEWLAGFLDGRGLMLDVETDRLIEEIARDRKTVSNFVAVEGLIGSGLEDYRKVVDGSLIIWTDTKTGRRYVTSVFDPLFAGDFMVEE